VRLLPASIDFNSQRLISSLRIDRWWRVLGVENCCLLTKGNLLQRRGRVVRTMIYRRIYSHFLGGARESGIDEN